MCDNRPAAAEGYCSEKMSQRNRSGCGSAAALCQELLPGLWFIVESAACLLHMQMDAPLIGFRPYQPTQPGLLRTDAMWMARM
jgi:hypothetical protein